MISPLQKISLSKLLQQPIMFDANIFMVGIERRTSDFDCSFENMKQLYMMPLFDSFRQIMIHEMVYKELDGESRNFMDGYIGKNVSIVSEDNLYGRDPIYTSIFNDISRHDRVLYIRGNSKDRGEVYSLAYAAFHKINYFSSKEVMVDFIAGEIKALEDVEIITFDIIVLLAYIYYMSRGDSSHNKALKSIYKRYCEDVIKRHKLPVTLKEYFLASTGYIN
ncbi:MAG: hypothetical protein K2O03_01610 [Lachnospiraceae bacterium]|nr:hypothetical protein [Lachnospiraceae bacterium]